MTESELYASLRLHRVPENLHGGIVRYIVSGIKPGGFLWAVLCDHLMDAVCRADDDISIGNLRAVMKWLHCETPVTCWGSQEIVDNWIEAKAKEFGIQEVSK